MKSSECGTTMHYDNAGSSAKKWWTCFSYATNRDRRTSRRLMTSSILLITSSIDLVRAGKMISKEQSHFDQCQK